MEKKQVVELYYDIVSPYSYLAFELLTKCGWENMQLKLKPVRVRDVLCGAGNTAPGKIPAKREYVLTDLTRLSSYYGIPFQMPKKAMEAVYVKGSEKALRLLYAIKSNYPDKMEDVSRQLYKRFWVMDDDVTEDDSLIQACIDAGLGQDVATTMNISSRQNLTSEELNACANEAIERGAFGTPTMFLNKDDETLMFFGTDRIFLLAQNLGHAWPVSLQ